MSRADERSGQQGPSPKRPVDGLEPYVQGRSTIDGVAEPRKLSANESLFGPSPAAKAAVIAAAEHVHFYPDGSQRALRTAIGETLQLDRDRIICGNGSDELISLLMKAYLGPDSSVVISQYSFGMAYIHATAMGAAIIEVGEGALKPDVDALVAAVEPSTRMLVIASPNNPVGQYLRRDELTRLHSKLPERVLLLIDAAYGDYVTASDYECGAALVESHDNVIMTRTFSKLYGLSGLRIGWAYAPASVHATLEKIRTPFNTNCVALAAAEAAIRDQHHAAEVRALNASELGRIAASMAAIGIEFIESFANFYLLRFRGDRHTAAGACAWLESHGIIPRPVSAGGPANCLRITVGRPEDNDAVIGALGDYMAA